MLKRQQQQLAGELAGNPSGLHFRLKAVGMHRKRLMGKLKSARALRAKVLAGQTKACPNSSGWFNF